MCRFRASRTESNRCFEIWQRPRYNRANLMFWPIYSAGTSLDALKTMIIAADRCWNFCSDAPEPREPERTGLAALKALGDRREAFRARRAVVTLDKVYHSLSIVINDVYEHKWSHKPYYSADRDPDDIFAASTFSHRWAEFNRYEEDEDDPFGDSNVVETPAFERGEPKW